MNTENILRHYLVAAIWATTDQDGNPLDDSHSISDFPESELTKARKDISDFVAANLAMLEACGLTEEQIGHDFFLTRCGHGAGFWDRGLGDVGRALTDAARTYGDVSPYEGDDGNLYFP